MALGSRQFRRDEVLDTLAFPLRNAGEIRWVNQGEMEESYVHPGVHCVRQPGVVHPNADVALLSIGGVKTLVTRVTPCAIREEATESSTLAMMVAGDSCSYRDGSFAQVIGSGDIHLNPRVGGIVRAGYFSGIVCDIEHRRLARTMHAMSGGSHAWNPEMPCLLKGGGSDQARGVQANLWHFFSFVDQLLAESQVLAAVLGLDDQLYRLLALTQFQAAGELERVQRRWAGVTSQWAKPMDDLVDYIRQNAHLNLTLTDLEEQSHYSARHLQSLFREKFDCTPMQFVRRQRLAVAMERLETAGCGDTVTCIARDCGYRHVSNFTSDFQREFGVNPSVVLRASRRRQTDPV